MISVVVPVYNEEGAIELFLKELSLELKHFPKHEIVVVNDGSTDSTPEILRSLSLDNLTIIDHAENIGYGKSLLDGLLAAKYECAAIIDGDGSYAPRQIKELYAHYPRYDMVVGARQGREYTRGLFKRPARLLFNYLVKYATGRKVPDVNSGLRIFNKNIALRFKDSLCTGFSFTTTITLLFLLNHYYVKYVPIEYFKRKGNSKVSHFKDTLRAGQIIVQTIVCYNPVKLFLLLASFNALFGILFSVVNYFLVHTVFLSILSAICVSSFIPIFALGLVCERIRKNV